MKAKICRIFSAVGPGLAIGFSMGVAMESWVNGLALSIPLIIARLASLKLTAKDDKNS
jgi:hypothetical protein